MSHECRAAERYRFAVMQVLLMGSSLPPGLIAFSAGISSVIAITCAPVSSSTKAFTFLRPRVTHFITMGLHPDLNEAAPHPTETPSALRLHNRTAAKFRLADRIHFREADGTAIWAVTVL